MPRMQLVREGRRHNREGHVLLRREVRLDVEVQLLRRHLREVHQRVQGLRESVVL